MWLWPRTAAVALIGPLAGEPPYAVGAAIEKKKKKKKERKKKEKNKRNRKKKRNKKRKRMKLKLIKWNFHSTESAVAYI